MPLNDVNQDQQFGYISSEFFTIEYRDGVNYNPIPGVQDVSFDGSTAPPRDVISANTAAQQRLGISRVGQVTVNATALPQHPAWRKIRDAQYARELMHFRVRINADKFFESQGTGAASSKFTISAVGVVGLAPGTGQGAQAKPTIAGTPLGEGQLIVSPKTGSKKGYVITEIDDTGAITALEVDTSDGTYDTPTAVSTGADYIVYSPAPLERIFSGYISQGADTSMSAESEMTTTLVIAPPVRVPDWAVYLPS